MDTLTICIIILLSAIFIVGIIILIRYLHKKNIEKYKEEANFFLSKFKDILYSKFIDIIHRFNYRTLQNLNDIEIRLIDTMIKEGHKYINSEIEELKDSCLSQGALKILDHDFIEKFIDTIIKNIDIFKSVEEKLGDRYKELQDTFSKEDKELNKQYSDESIYYINDKNIKLDSTTSVELVDSDENGLSLRGYKLPSKAEEALLNKPIDEEESYNADDESMEIIGEDTASTYIDSLGRYRDKATNKIIKK